MAGDSESKPASPLALLPILRFALTVIWRVLLSTEEGGEGHRSMMHVYFIVSVVALGCIMRTCMLTMQLLTILCNGTAK